MVALFFRSLGRFARLVWLSLWPPSESGARRSPRRLVTMVLFLPLLGLVQLLHWLGLLLDELFFRGYRDVRVGAPLLVLGIPRSGTTRLHHVLAEDPALTTFRTWECLFALSVTARHFWRLAGALDARLGRPVARLLAQAERRLFSELEAVHPFRLAAPEEDYFALVPALACFILVVPFPYADWIARMAFFDRDVAPDERARLLDYYESCLKRHLYFHGSDKRLLSKNAAFASLTASLLERFPDARIICCHRPPAQTVASQLSSLASGVRFFDDDPRAAAFTSDMIDVLEYAYGHLAESLAPLPAAQVAYLDMAALGDLEGSVARIYAQLGLPLDQGFATALARQHAIGTRYRSSHRYALTDFGLTDAVVEARFAAPYRTLLAAADG